MVLVHRGLRRNGIALPVGVMLNGATPGPLWGGPVAEAAWQSVFASARNLDGWANCLTMAVAGVGAVAPARVDEILLGMAAAATFTAASKRSCFVVPPRRGSRRRTRRTSQPAPTA